MKIDMLTMERFSSLLDTRGADLDAWPPNEASQARRLVRSSAEGRGLYCQARKLDETLDSALPPLDTELAGLRKRILERVGEARPEAAWMLHLADWLNTGSALMRFVVRPTALAMIPLMVGFAVGLSMPRHDPAVEELTTEMSLLAMIDRYEAYQDAP